MKQSLQSMLAYVRVPCYELALSGGALYSYVAYMANLYQCSRIMVYHTLSLGLSSIWFHLTKSAPSFWVDQVVLNSWVLMFVYEAYIRHWMAVGIVFLSILYACLMFYVGQAKRIYAYHPSRFWSIFFHLSVHIQSAMLAIIIITFFPVPK
jgi:hypothetical protein